MVAEPEPLSFMPPSITESRWAPTTTVRSARPCGVSAMTLEVVRVSERWRRTRARRPCPLGWQRRASRPSRSSLRPQVWRSPVSSGALDDLGAPLLALVEDNRRVVTGLLGVFCLSRRTRRCRVGLAPPGSVSDAGTKSWGSQPLVEPGCAGGGIRTSLVGTRRPVTSPLPEYSNVAVS